MTVLTSTRGQAGLPRYFGAVFKVAQSMEHGRLDIRLPDGRVFRAEGRKPGPAAELVVNSPEIFARLIREGDLGFCDAYMDGWWSTPDLQNFMDLVHADNDMIYNGFPGMNLVRAYERLRFRLRSNSKRQARKNVSYHYDLGNDFYELWLDDTMTYSSAYFKTGRESLEKAQTQKYGLLIDQMGVRPGDHVLEIGCGWGGFAEYAARQRGLKVTCLTISKKQHDFAVARMRQLGLEGRVAIKLQDYRDELGRYDGIASIEMFEAVGEKYWPTYFSTVHNRLKPGKNATLQVIMVQERRWETYRRSVDFIQKYIFPGGMLPSPGILRKEVENAGLIMRNSVEFGQSYGKTLRRWHRAFNETWDQAQAMGFDTRFRRMWNFYLTSCASTFQSGYCNVAQITITRPG